MRYFLKKNNVLTYYNLDSSKKYCLTINKGKIAERSIPIGLLLRDHFKFAQNIKEAKFILNKNLVKVNNEFVRELRFPVQLTEIVTLFNINNPDLFQHYRLTIKNKKYFAEPVENCFVYYSILNKSLAKKTLNHPDSEWILKLSTGRVMRVPRSLEINVGDTLVYDFTDRKIVKVIKPKVGSSVIAFLSSGRGLVKGKSEILLDRFKESVSGSESVKYVKIGNSHYHYTQYLIIDEFY